MKISYLIIAALFSFSAIVMGISYKDQIADWISGGSSTNNSADYNVKNLRQFNTLQESVERTCERRWKTNQKMVGFCIIKLKKERGL